jgi:(S)-ureidoglycine aminohydrolase
MAGASFVMNWSDMVFKAHDKGGIRQLFDRKTAMFSRFDIHITTLNPGLSSHAPHTHKNEEIILMVDGDGEMLVNGRPVRCDTGDAVYVDSMVPHNLTNIGKVPSTYFAIQWN